MYTVITKGNEVSKHNNLAKLGLIDHIIVITDGGEVKINKGNPINWPADATDGMQAIVDVKAGTLRFAHGWWSWAVTEFVVSEYVGPAEDRAPAHVLDRISSWPDSALATVVAPEGWGWKYLNYGWVLVNDKEGVEFHEGHWLRNHHENKKKHTDVAQPSVTAASMLTAALGHMEDRAKTYDAPGGERSMGKTVAAFNVITGHTLTEEAGWLFMEILKQVRSQQGGYRADSYEDLIAYAALRGECAARERGNK